MSFQAYNVKTKTKHRNIKDAVITRTSKGAYMIQGFDEETNDKLTTLASKDKVIAGLRQGWGTTTDADLLEILKTPEETTSTNENESINEQEKDIPNE